MERPFWHMLVVLFVVLGAVIAVMAFAAGGMERACNERGGWFTYVGGYPTCLPPGGK